MLIQYMLLEFHTKSASLLSTLVTLHEHLGLNWTKCLWVVHNPSTWMARYHIMSSKVNHPGKISQVFDMVRKYVLVGTSCPGAHLPVQGVITSSGPFA